MPNEKPAGVRPTEQVSLSFIRLRQQKRLTYTEISNRLAAMGQPIPTRGLVRIEAGERRVDIDEVVALARAFGVPPLTLIFPVGHAAETELLPGDPDRGIPATRVDPWTAAKWFCGKATLGDEPLPAEAADLRRFEEHDRLAEEAANAKVELELFDPDGGDDRREAERRWRTALRDLRTLRAVIRQRGLTPPPLDDFLAVADDKEYRFLTAADPGSNLPGGLLVEEIDGRTRPVSFTEDEGER